MGNANFLNKIILSGIIVILLPLIGATQDFSTLNNQFVALYEKGKFKEAIPIGEKALALAKKEFGEKNINYAIAAENLANAHLNIPNNEEALHYFLVAKKAYIAVGGENILEVGLSNNSIGTAYLRQNNLDSAIAYFVAAYHFFLQYPEDQYDNLVVISGNLCQALSTQNNARDLQSVSATMLPIIENKEGKQHTHYLDMLSNLVFAFRNLHLIDSALSRQYQLTDLYAEVNGKASGEYASGLDMLCDLHRLNAAYAESEKHIQLARQIRAKLNPPDYYGLAAHYHIAANLYGEIARFDLSDLYYDSALVLIREKGFQKDELYTNVMRSQAYTEVEAGRLVAARQTLLQLLKTYEDTYGKEFAGSAEILITLGNVEYQINSLASAQQHVEQGMAIEKKYAGEQSNIMATAYELKGMIQHKMGKTAEGLLLLNKALDINKSLFGEFNSYTASTLSNQGIIYQEMGDFAAAEKVLRQSFIIREKIFGTNHPQCAIALNNLAAVLIMQSRFTDADKLLAACIEILKSRGMMSSNIALTTISNIAMLMEKQDDNASATQLYEQVLSELRKDTLERSGVLETVLANLCINRLNQGNYEEALKYGKEAMQITEKNSGKNSLGFIRAGNNCMVAYIRLGQLDKARTLAKDLEMITRKILGDSAAILVNLYSNLASLEAKSGNLDLAIQYLHQSLGLQSAHYEKNLYALSERDQVAYWQQQAYLFQMYPSLLLASHQFDSAHISSMVNQQLSLKGMILQQASGVLKKIRAIQDPQLQQIVDAWQTSRTLYLQQSALPISDRMYSTDSLSVVANNLEQLIHRKAGQHGLQQQPAITWQQVQQALAPNEAAVEYLRFPLFRQNQFTDSLHYAAIVIRHTGMPVLIPLGSETQVEWCMTGGNTENQEANISKLYRSKITGKKSNSPIFTGDSLYALIWKPIMPYLNKVNTVGIAPDGLLHKIAFAALPVSKDALLLDSFQLQQFSSIRQMAKSNGINTSLSSVVLQGGAHFNQGNAPGTSIAWADLPGTVQELLTLRQLFVSKGIKASVDSGANATEENFKRLNGKAPDILHIATHGYFLPDPPPASVTTLSQMKQSAGSNFSRSDDPLMRSGIVFTGANKYWQGSNFAIGKDDGILTAFEIAQTNLQGTKLVVLSACETGLGEVRQSEGVFGLQRALKMAGVQQMLLSLWQVPDKETVELMEIFYTQMLQGKTAREAYYFAQQTMRAKYPPFLWAAFVLME